MKQGTGGRGGRWNILNFMSPWGWVRKGKSGRIPAQKNRAEAHFRGGKKKGNSNKRILDKDYHK